MFFLYFYSPSFVLCDGLVFIIFLLYIDLKTKGW